jgi:PDZ domain-containing protein
MVQSQNDATTAALHELGIPSKTAVGSVTKGAPADGKLLPGDVLTTVDGHPVTDAASLRSLISTRKPGQDVVIGYTRKGVPGTATLTTASSGETPPRAIIGIAPSQVSTVKVDIRLQDVGGPSAGLMFALGIIEKLGPESLTGGRTIAGTGEITADGKVGAIGGIAQKMRGARAEKATVFLSPAQNCDEARANKPSGLTLVKVSTLKDALAALATLRAGGTPPSC